MSSPELVLVFPLFLSIEETCFDVSFVSLPCFILSSLFAEPDLIIGCLGAWVLVAVTVFSTTGTDSSTVL